MIFKILIFFLSSFFFKNQFKITIAIQLNSWCQQIGVFFRSELIERKAARWNLSEMTCQQHRSAEGEQLIALHCAPQNVRLV